MKNLYKAVRISLEEQKKEFKFVFYSPKENAMFCVRSWFWLVTAKGKRIRRELNYYDGKIFGLYRAMSKCADWKYIGKL
jgi:hypothetical protein